MTDAFEAYVQRLVTDFAFFLRELWRDRGLDKLAPLSDVEIDMAVYAVTGPDRNVSLGFRGIGKTHFITAAGCCWDLLRDPNWKEFVVSKSGGEAKKTAKLIRDWIGLVPFLQHLAPRGDQRDAATYFDVGPAAEHRQPSVTAIGIEGQLPGNRAHRIWADDVETPGNTKTLTAREDLDKLVKEFSAIVYPGGRINYVGTYHHEESLYIKLQGRGFALRSYPMVYPAPEEKVLNLAPILAERLASGKAKPGDPVCPRRFGPVEIAERRAEGRTHFAMQYQLIADLGDSLRYPLTLKDLIVFPCQRDTAPLTIAWGHSTNDGSTRIPSSEIPSLGLGSDCLHRPIYVDRDWARYTRSVMWVDPAGKGADRLGYACVSSLNGFFYVKAVGGLIGGATDANMSALAALAFEHRVREVFVEENFGGDAMARLLQVFISRIAVRPSANPDIPHGWTASVSTENARGQKELRIIAALEPPMNAHRVVLHDAVARNERLQHQLTRLTRQRNSLAHEDELESVAAAIGKCNEDLAIDPIKAAARQHDAWLNEQLTNHYRAAGVFVPAASWIKRA